LSSTTLALFTLTSSRSEAGTVTLSGPSGLSEGESGLRDRRESCVADDDESFELESEEPFEGAAATAVDFERGII
jgi:hypothetical protein